VERGNEKLEFIGQAPDQPVTSQHQVSR
jgi:hypothetical protein